MSDATPHAGPAVRASDAEREQTVALLQRHFADGRLTQAELEERAGAAYSAHTRAQLRDLTADLPAAQQQPPPSGMVLDQRLLIILLCVHPPAALIYWLLCRRKRPATASTEPATALEPDSPANRKPDHGSASTTTTPAPAATYGLVCLGSAVAFTILTRAIIRADGGASLVAQAVGRDVKGRTSMVIYAAATALAFVDP